MEIILTDRKTGKTYTLQGTEQELCHKFMVMDSGLCKQGQSLAQMIDALNGSGRYQVKVEMADRPAVKHIHIPMEWVYEAEAGRRGDE